ncbi:unnamed protein product [Nezara viridula]|uniref:Fatty acyl-CoA reductase n=1 Tax=Nezara viridula TaxID=85310 RepID=A0A9P0EAC2_NEZVI|nr:unnamed protein product [Nezara viridula]
MEEESQIIPFYNGKTLFITGASGFMGKVLLEKLLYTCPKVEKIYVLLRAKRGKAMESRLEEIFKLPLFSRIRSECPAVFQKVIPIAGDVSLPELGLSAVNEKVLIEEVDIVVHGAASLRLEAKLKENINMNTEGTLRVVQLCRKIKNLQLLVHISTAFCHCEMDIMEEQTYPPSYDPMDIIQLSHWLPENVLEKITPDLLKPHPNSYTFSKRLAEAVVASYYPEVPSCILRPSIVIPTWKEPMEGWVDNLNGPIGILIGGAKGVIRSMHCFIEYSAELIPVDMAINGIMVAIPKFVTNSSERPKDIPVVNLTQSDTYVVTWGDMLEKGKEIAFQYPFETMLWYPNGRPYKVKLFHDISIVLFHWIPAYVIDFLLLIFGQKRFMIRVQTKIQAGLDVLQYFTTREWKFKNEKLLALRSSLNSFDREKFTLDFEKIDMKQYMTSAILGARHFLLKEDPNSIPRSRMILKLLYVLDRMATVTFYVLLGWILVSCSDTAAAALDSAISAAQSLLPFSRNVEQHLT